MLIEMSFDWLRGTSVYIRQPIKCLILQFFEPEHFNRQARQNKLSVSRSGLDKTCSSDKLISFLGKTRKKNGIGFHEVCRITQSCEGDWAQNLKTEGTINRKQ